MKNHANFILATCLLAACGLPGCALVCPEVSSMPVLHNPFPQLSRVAVVPFFNQSDEPTVDGREFALAYFGELQGIPGFEVVPVGVVEEALIQHRISLSDPDSAAAEIRRLGRVLGVDAIVVGTVTDFSPYYPQRCGIHVEWYATNSGFHEIPAGYGLPWGTPEEEYISETVAFEAELALAKAQLDTQSPICNDEPVVQPPAPFYNFPMQQQRAPLPAVPESDTLPGELPQTETPEAGVSEAIDEIESLPPPIDASGNASDASVGGTRVTATSAQVDVNNAPYYSSEIPASWPDAAGFLPPGPRAVRPPCVENPGPVMTHTRIFRGNDPEFTSALAAYVDFRDDARFGGWRSYLERSDDFIRFSCHYHISQMLEARGGATETRVVQRWSDNR